MRAHDWAATPLGPPETWPQTLRTAVRLMLNNGHPMYIWWGPESLCFYNDAYSRSIGPEQHPGSLGRPAREVWAEIWDIIGPQIEQVMSGKGATWNENALVPITRNGKREEVYWTYSYSPLDDENAPHGVGGVLVICTETTQQVQSLKRSAEELGRFASLVQARDLADVTTQRLASIVESSDDAIISKDLNGVIMTWNSGAERIFGYTVDEAIGKPITMLIPDDYLDEEPLILGRVIKGERVDHFETVRKRKDGSLVDVSVTVSPIRDSSGKVIGASKVGRDITDGRKAVHRQKLLLQEMSHRIKNLFAVTSGLVSLSARAAPTAKELAHTVQSRLAALARAHDLTLQGGAEENAERKISLAELIGAILSPYDAGTGHIVIGGPPVEIGANASTSFALLLHEFATNSVKYGALSGDAGSVRVEWRCEAALNLSWTENGGVGLGAVGGAGRLWRRAGARHGVGAGRRHRNATGAQPGFKSN